MGRLVSKVWVRTCSWRGPPWKGTEPLSQRAGLPSIRSGRSRDALVPSTADLLTQPFLRLRAVLCIETSPSHNPLLKYQYGDGFSCTI